MRKLFIIFFIFILPAISHAAIARDNGRGQTNANNTGQSFSYTVTGPNPILIIWAKSDSGNDDMTGATYNGVAMTLAMKGQRCAGVGKWAYIWYLKNPATGAHTLTTSFSATVVNSVSVSSFTGAAQTGGVDISNTYCNTTGETGNVVVTTNVTTANSWLYVMQVATDVDPDSIVNGTTQINAAWIGDGADSNGNVGSGNQTIGYHWSVSDRHLMMAIAFAPAASTTPSSDSGVLLFFGWFGIEDMFRKRKGFISK